MHLSTIPVLRRIALGVIVLGLMGCVQVTDRLAPQARDASGFVLSPSDVVAVTAQVEPVATALCEQETPLQRCDFSFLLDRDLRQPANAFQTVADDGRPLVIVTLALIRLMDSRDELAFVLGHEAGHHIAEHIPAQRRSAQEASDAFGDIARQQGGGEAEIARAAQMGAVVGARRFSQTAELEADVLGTAIAWRAGFDPVRGARLFSRLPDPGRAFLATHPANASRRAIVRQTLAQLEAAAGT